MKAKKLFVALSIFLVIGVNIALSVNATEEYTYVDMDSYIDSGSSTSNYGSSSYFYVGEYSGDDREAYFQFDLDNVPVGYTSAKISLYIWYTSNSPEIDVYIITDSWDEDTITWDNRPNKGVKIQTTTPGFLSDYEIDITAYVSGVEEISICLASTTVGAYAQGYTGDYSSFSTSYRPRIEWDTTFQTTMTIIIVVLIVAFVSIIGLYVFLKKQKKKPKKPRTRRAPRIYPQRTALGTRYRPRVSPIPPPQPAPAPRPVLVPQPAPAPRIKTEEVFCHFCGSKVQKANATFCEECGTKLSD